MNNCFTNAAVCVGGLLRGKRRGERAGRRRVAGVERLILRSDWAEGVDGEVVVGGGAGGLEESSREGARARWGRRAESVLVKRVRSRFKAVVERDWEVCRV